MLAVWLYVKNPAPVPKHAARPEVHQQLPSMGLTVVVIRFMTLSHDLAIEGLWCFKSLWTWLQQSRIDMASDRTTINQTMAVPCFSVVCVLFCGVSYCYMSMLMHVCVYIYGYCLVVSPFVPALVRFSVTCKSIDAICTITSR